MTDCPHISNVDAYADGALGADAARAMAAHVRGCPACGERLRQTQSFRAALAAFPPSRLSDAALGRLHDAVADAWQRRQVRWAWQLTGLAAAVLVAAATWFATLPPATPAPQPGWRQVAQTGGLSLQADDDALADARDVTFASWVVQNLDGGGDDDLQRERQ
jgi:anti-sigma factor RsiW